MKRTLLFAGLLALSVSMSAQLKQGVLKNVTKVTADKERHENPRWSPDGSMIAFTDEGYDNLYVMGSKGGAQKKISSLSGVGYGYSWSADGNEILVRDTRWTGNEAAPERRHAIYSVSLSGSAVKLTDDAVYMQPAAWRYSPSGKKSIVAPDAKINGNLSSLKALPAKKTKAMSKATDAAKVSFIADGESLWVVDNSGNKKKIYNDAAYSPALSPDGKKVAFNAVDDVCVMNIDGTGLKKLAVGFNPSWVNNSQIVIERTTDDGHTYLSGDLHLINIESGASKQLTSTSGVIEMQPSVSADGTKIAFISFTDGQVYVGELN